MNEGYVETWNLKWKSLCEKRYRNIVPRELGFGRGVKLANYKSYIWDFFGKRHLNLKGFGGVFFFYK